MTIREKNLVKNFLFLTELDKEETERTGKVFSRIEKIAEKLSEKDKKECLDLEEEIMSLIDVVKWNYMDYGAKLQEAIEDYDLDWTPETLKEIEKCSDKNAA